jgi:heptosyltransferase III
VDLVRIKRRPGVLFSRGPAILARVRRLIIRPGAIGDFIVSLPAMESLKTGYTEVWTASAHVPLVQFADAARSIASSGIDTFGICGTPDRLIAELRSFDSIVSWYGAAREDFRRLVNELRLPFQFLPALPAEGCALHAADFYLEQIRGIAPGECDGVPRIRCSEARENFAVIHPFSGSPRKNWPLEKFQRLAAQLERVMPVQWCAGPEDPPLAGAVRTGDLWELARWLARARLYVGNDSGITHLAAAVGTPVLALFGASDPQVWQPRGTYVKVAWFGGGR